MKQMPLDMKHIILTIWM